MLLTPHRLYKSYRNLEDVRPGIDIMSDLTGGVVVHKATAERNRHGKHSDAQNTVMEILKEGYEKKFPMTCSTPAVRNHK